MPAVHDVAAVRRSQALYDALLHRVVLHARTPVHLALEEVTTGSAARELQNQLHGLRQLLLEERPSEAGAAKTELMEHLRPFVQDDVRRVELDPALSEAMTREFATALLDTALRRFRKNARQRTTVSRSDLEALEGKRRDDVWPELAETLRPYGVSQADARAILWASLLEAAGDGRGDQDTELPGGLRLSVAMLQRMFQNRPEPSGLSPLEVTHHMLNGNPDAMEGD